MERVRNAFRKHNYLNELPSCRECSYGLKREDTTVDIAGGMKIQRYKSVPDVVSDEGVALKTPEDKMTTRGKKAIEKINQ